MILCLLHSQKIFLKTINALPKNGTMNAAHPLVIFQPSDKKLRRRWQKIEIHSFVLNRNWSVTTPVCQNMFQLKIILKQYYFQALKMLWLDSFFPYLCPQLDMLT